MKKSFEEIYPQIKRMIHMFAGFVKPTLMYAYDDIVQELNIHVWKKYTNNFDPNRGNLSHYVFKACYNKTGHIIKKIVSEKKHYPMKDVEVSQLKNTNDPLDTFIIEERTKEMYEKIKKILTPQQFKILFLNLKGYKSAEIARSLNCERQNIHEHLKRIRKKLKKSLLNS